MDDATGETRPHEAATQDERYPSMIFRPWIIDSEDQDESHTLPTEEALNLTSMSTVDRTVPVASTSSTEVSVAFTAPPTGSGDEHIRRTCIIHASKGVSKERVLPFDQNKWRSLQKAAEARSSKRQFQGSKYFDIVQKLPDELNREHGYHASCYKNFTAIPITQNIDAIDSLSQTTPKSKLRSSVESPNSLHSPVGIFANACLFCNAVRRSNRGKVEYLGQCLTKEGEQSLREAATLLGDDDILAKISGIDLIAKELKYHHSCRKAYNNRLTAERNRLKDTAETTLQNTSTDAISAYVEKSVIVNSRPELLTSIYARYMEFCEDSGELPFTTRQYLATFLLRKFEDKIKVTTDARKNGSIIYSSNTAEHTIRVAYDYTSSHESLISKTALLLRKNLKEMETSTLPENPSLKDLEKGECDTPQLLLTFFNILYGGPNPSRHSKRVKRLSESTSQDVIFITSGGETKPKKHIALGSTVKSMTGSRKLVTMLNRLGHCPSYHITEEVETGIAQAILDKKEQCPEGTVRNVPVGLAFDNFDELSNTLSGADTLHDTMGILYQQVIPDEPCNSDADRQDTNQHSSNKVSKGSRKRKLDVYEQPLEPYRKHAKLSTFKYQNIEYWDLADVGEEATQRDLVWMMCHAFSVVNTPMWVGFNSLYHTDPLPKQVVKYMQNLRQPITSVDVIQETLKIAQRCAKECNQPYGVVTYDLNAAKPALQIQSTESPKYDDVFVMLGPFHVELAFFKAIGKVIAESGGSNMLTETGVLAPGSLRGFINGKHFNRCKRLHPILALSFQILHFRSFLENFDKKDELCETITRLQHRNECVDDIEDTDVFRECVDQYLAFAASTRKGQHGATAQFWFMYFEYIGIFHKFERAIRTNNIDLFIATLTPITDLFFATNHQNYARWLSKYQLDLLNMDKTHPGLRKILDDGVFTIRRTDNMFSRCPVDLTLEQTINADAASRLTGISAATNNYTARCRWMLTKSTRAALISVVADMAGMSNRDDASAEVKSGRIKRDTSDIGKVTKHIQESCNPFINVPSDKLYNLSTGKSTSAATQQCLLAIPKKGSERHKQFVQECAEDSSRFQKPITRAKLLTFKSECVSSRRPTNNSLTTLKCSRDLMGRLVVLATKQKLDLQYVFMYPLTPVPLSLSEGDGSMTKTDKNALFKKIESKTTHTHPDTVDSCIIDGNYLLHTLPKNLPPTYGGLARTILIKSLSFSSKSVHVIFDTYASPSIKDSERKRRGVEDRPYVITGAQQTRPRNMGDALKSVSFKKRLPIFLVEEWRKPEYVPVIGQCDVYVGFEEICYNFRVGENIVERNAVPSLESNHHEADTRIILHAKYISDTNHGGNIVVRASDTDIAILLLHHSHKITETWMDIGTSSTNARRYVNISKLAKTLGDTLCAALPGFHAYTGSDYTSAFVRRGKVRPFDALEKSKEAQTAFAGLGSGNPVSTQIVKSLESFTCAMYGAKDAKMSLNDYRYTVFEKGFGPKSSSKNPLNKLKGVEASNIPPCQSELGQHISRAAFVAQMWTNADQRHIKQNPGQSDGWDVVNDQYQLIWFDGPQFPDNLHAEQDENVSDSDTEGGYDSSSDESLSDSDTD